MPFQTIELAGQRFVILPEAEFRQLQEATQPASAVIAPAVSKRKFAAVAPEKVSGTPASEMLIQDRR